MDVVYLGTREGANTCRYFYSKVYGQDFRCNEKDIDKGLKVFPNKNLLQKLLSLEDKLNKKILPVVKEDGIYLEEGTNKRIHIIFYRSKRDLTLKFYIVMERVLGDSIFFMQPREYLNIVEICKNLFKTFDIEEVNIIYDNPRGRGHRRFPIKVNNSVLFTRSLSTYIRENLEESFVVQGPYEVRSGEYKVYVIKISRR